MTSSPWSSTSWWWNTPPRRRVRTGPRSSPVSASSSRLKVDSEKQKSLFFNLFFRCFVYYLFFIQKLLFSFVSALRTNSGVYTAWTLEKMSTIKTIASFVSPHRQHRRSDRKLPRDAAHWLEGVPAAAVLPAGNRGVCRGGSRGVPEETGEEQEVLLSEARKRKWWWWCWCCFVMNCLPGNQSSTSNVKFFCFLRDCTNVYIFWSTVSGVNHGSVWCWSEGAGLVSAAEWFWSTLVYFSLRVLLH